MRTTAGPGTRRTSGFCTRRTRSTSTRSSGGACARTSRFPGRTRRNGSTHAWRSSDHTARSSRSSSVDHGSGSHEPASRAVGADVSEPEQPADQPTPEQADEELLEQVEEQLRKLKVSDLLVQTLYTISSLGYRKLSDEHRDLEQAKLAMEALRALVPVLERTITDDVVRDFRQVTANLQLAYADVAKT